jgi:hypothetical protein
MLPIPVQSQVIARRVGYVLLRAQVSLGGLDGLAERNLNWICSIGTLPLCASLANVRRTSWGASSSPIFFAFSLTTRYKAWVESLSPVMRSALSTARNSFPSVIPAAVVQRSIRGFGPYRNGHGADPFPLADEIGDQPAPIALLNIFQLERNELFSSQSGAEEQPEQRAIALRLQALLTRIS